VRYTATNITTFVMIGFSIWILFTRFRPKPDPNWPLFYYLAVVAYHQYLPGRLHPHVLFAGVVLALTMRFEFVGGFFAKVFRAAEFAIVFFLGYQFWDSLIL
jgi:hypothetical protein